MTYDHCPCCEITALPHASDCTFAADCPVECEQFDALAELRAEVARLRLTDAERGLVQEAVEEAERQHRDAVAGLAGDEEALAPYLARAMVWRGLLERLA